MLGCINDRSDGILSLLINNEFVVDAEDLKQFTSSFQLNQFFEFRPVGHTFDHMHPDQFYLVGPHIVVQTDELSGLVQNHPFITVDPLLML